LIPEELDAIRTRLRAVENLPDDHTTWWQIGRYDAPALLTEVERLRKDEQDTDRAFERLEALVRDRMVPCFPDEDLYTLRVGLYASLEHIAYLLERAIPKLRAARNVIEAARELASPVDQWLHGSPWKRLSDALAAYDDATEADR
jgi:hypothetical protein